MKAGSAARTQKTSKLSQQQDTLSLVRHGLSIYCLDRFLRLDSINKLCQRGRSLFYQLRCDEPSEWIQQLFPKQKGLVELSQLIEYYRYYQTTPTIAHPLYLDLMSAYHTRTKTLYYRQIKRELQLLSNTSSDTMQKNISQQQGINNKSGSNTFYVLPAVVEQTEKQYLNDNNTTIQGILKTMHSKVDCCHKAVKDIDKAYQFRKQKQKSQQREEQRSHQKRQLKTSQTHVISTSSFKKTIKKVHTQQPQRINNHKSLFGDQPQRSPNRISRGKKLLTTASCQSISRQDIVPNHQRREKTIQKNSSSKKKRLSQANSHQKKGHRGQSTQKLQNCGKDPSRSSKSGCKKPRSGKKKRPELQSTVCVKAMIDKVKNKIKAQKCIMLKKYGQSRQSYTKSIDSTCGETGKAHIRR